LQQQFETLSWTQLAGVLGCGGIVCKPGWNLGRYSSSTISINIQLKVRTKGVRNICGTLATSSETLNKFLLVLAPGRINVTFNTFCYIGHIVLLNGYCGLQKHPTIKDRSVFTFTYDAATV
jgi:hypothetical protein